MLDFYIKRGDTTRDLVIQCQDEFEQPIDEDLEGAIVEFHMMQVGEDGSATVLISDGEGAVIDADQKLIGYAWQPGDTDVASTEAQPHQAELEVTLASGGVMTFPNRANIRVHIMPDIA